MSKPLLSNVTIQVANGTGLLHRLKPIDRLSASELNYNADKRVSLAQSWFASKPLEELAV